MKQSFLKIPAYLCILVYLGSFSLSATAQDWTKDWFDSMTHSGPSSFSGQRRGYIQGGQFNGRFRLATDNPFSVSPPRVRAGCGGIDLFAGGLSFLDPEYLVEKFENILQAAPALAFSMALKAHCETCEDVMSKLEATSSFLNSIQVNDCRMANQVAKLVTGDNPDFVSNVLEEATGSRSLEEAVEKHYHGAQQSIRDNDNQVPVDLHDEVAACPAAVRELFADGSVIDHAAERVGMLDMAPIVRAYIGDILISWPSSENAPTIRSIDRCPRVDRFSSYDFLTGEVEGRPANGGPCSRATAVSVISMVRQNMLDIGAGVKSKRAFTADEVNFINQSAQPVWEIVRNGVLNGSLDQAVGAYEFPIASSLAYRVFDDLLTNIDFLISKAASDAATPGIRPATGGETICNLAIYGAARAKLGRLREDLVVARRGAFEAYQVTVQQQHAISAQAALFKADRATTAKDFVKAQSDG
ncbi:conjugal transfer protein TraH [Kordiimonas aquimaris]|uniref:conjugal transfer protein TraH n=1 Tax=Kordiimonas aquimaris TaxID=707591 RepID=UPI0021D01C0F|nr:conjugal transfer protein TraH [Kordiimonas aquimaris]